MVMIKRFLLLIFFGSLLTGVWNAHKPLPKGLAYESPDIAVDDVLFLHDLTYQKEGQKLREQQIFPRVFSMIDSAQRFVVLDLFLFNDDHDKAQHFDGLAQALTDRLVAGLQERHLKVVLITDPINTFYGAYDNPYLRQLEKAGAEVVMTDLSRLRDSNPLYSGFYRLTAGNFGISHGGTIVNPFSADSPKVSAGALLRMFNFKANHRKLIVTEQGVLAASANPHDASSNHSNIAFYIESPYLVKAALEAEQAVLRFSGSPTDLTAFEPLVERRLEAGVYKARLLTESRILERMRAAVQSTGAGDTVDIGVFYLSHRGLIGDLTAAAGRGVKIRLVLDANKDAFGREKNGVPNRQTAQELLEKGGGNIEVRWYLTQGEQFHSKLMKVNRPHETVLFGGSCNFTRRNFEDLNLEANLMISGPPDAPAFRETDAWFNRIWANEDGIYTGDSSLFADKSLPKVWLYRIMEATGLSTF